MVMHMKGIVQFKATSSGQPIVTKPADGMVCLTQITKQYQKTSTNQSKWLTKPAVREKIEEIRTKYNLKREDIVCCVSCMDCSPRPGKNMFGGCFAHPVIARMYERYLQGDVNWYDTDNATPFIPIVPPAQISRQTSLNFATNGATPTPIPPTANKALKSQILQSDADKGDMYFDTFLALVDQYGAKQMFDRIDDVINEYTRSMIGKGDDFTADTISALRTIRDVFRMDYTPATTKR